MSIRIISGGRKTGRTTAMIRAAAESFAYIVCPDRRQVQHIQWMAREMGVDIPLPITWDDFIKGRYHRPGVRGFVIDNLDDCIQRTTRVPVLAASVGPVDPLPLPAEHVPTVPCADCGYPEGRQSDCRTCKGVPIVEDGEQQ